VLSFVALQAIVSNKLFQLINAAKQRVAPTIGNMVTLSPCAVDLINSGDHHCLSSP